MKVIHKVSALPALLAVALTAMVSPAFAQEANTGASIIAKVNEAMSDGSTIAAAVVLGLFVIFGIKLLWRSK